MEEFALQLLTNYLKSRKEALQAQSRSINQEMTVVNLLLSKLEYVKEDEPEIEWENEIVEIMKNRKVPLTKRMILKELEEKFGNLYHRPAMNAISSVVVQNPRFKCAKPGHWELND